VRAVLLRYLAVVGIGIGLLAAVLFVASTVDARPPFVEEVALTLHSSDDELLALTSTSIEVRFSEPVRPDTAQSAFSVDPDVPGEFSWSGAVMRFTPGERLPLETEFTVAVDAGVVDEAGNRMEEPAEAFVFRTVGPPQVAGTQPADGDTEVPLDSVIVIEFTNLMDAALVEEAITIEPAIAFEARWAAERLSLVPIGGLRQATRYSVSIGTGARDSAGIPLDAEFRFSFETTSTPVRATRLVPANGVEGIAPATAVAIVFDRALDPGADVEDLFTIEPEVAGTVEVVAPPGAAGMRDPTPRVLRFTPSAPLEVSTTYRVTLERGVLAADGTSLSEPLVWSFTTAVPQGTLSNQVVFISDRAGIDNVWAMNSDGSGQRQVTAELSPVIDFAVAPDGRSVVAGDGAQLVWQPADGSDRRVLTPAGVLEFDPAWAPDGARFAFGRSELQTGAGLGIWTRAADGGDEQALTTLGDEPGASASGDPGTAPVLRAPRYAPDGEAIAFVDTAGRVGVVELATQRISFAAFGAAGPPVWLRDSSAVLLNGISAGLDPPPAGEPLGRLDPAGLRLAPEVLEELTIGKLQRGSSSVAPLDLLPGAARPAVSEDRLAFVTLRRAGSEAAGELWLASDPGDPEVTRRLLTSGDPDILSAAFGVERGSLVVSVHAPAGAASGGIWMVDEFLGQAVQLSEDGRQAVWLP
jgi:hypothetical protein